MPRRRTRSFISPESGIQITIRQAVVVLAIFVGVGSGYGYLVWTQASQGVDIKVIKDNQITVASSVKKATDEQDTKRERLGEQFIASNKEIADKVGQLTTAIAVQQKSLQSTDEKLSQLLSQVIQPPTVVPIPIPRR